MTRHNIQATYSLETRGPLHIGTGHGAGLDRGMLRDQNGLPYIPGSTIKGRARFAAVRICNWMDLPVYKDAVADVRRPEPSPNGPHGKPDLPARIFGYAWGRSTLRFSDARTSPPSLDPRADPVEARALRERAFGLREVRTGAARSRILGTVSHGLLFQSEVAPPGLVFDGKIQGYLDCDPSCQLADWPTEILVLWLALHLMVEDGLGGNKSSGSGKLAWAPDGRVVMMVDGQELRPGQEETSIVLGELCDLERNRTGAKV